MIKLTITLILSGALTGCIFKVQNLQDTDAIIADVSESSSLQPYCIVAIDGKPVRRASSEWITIIPDALVEEGTHTLTVNVGDDISAVETTVTATFEAGRRYQIEYANGELAVLAAAK